MQLTLREVSQLIRVPERTVTAWIKQRDLPAVLVNDQYRVNRAELLNWVAAHPIDLSTSNFHESYTKYSRTENLAGALELGGILSNVSSGSLRDVWSQIVQSMPLPESIDRHFLLELFTTRELKSSTCVGRGIAVPHVRYPVVLPVEKPVATLAYLAQPLVAQGPDGVPIDTLFVLVSPTPKVHMQLLAQLTTALQDNAFCELVKRPCATAELIAALNSILRQHPEKSLTGV